MKRVRLRLAWANLVLLVATGVAPSPAAGAAPSNDAESGPGEAIEASLAKTGKWEMTASALLVGATAVFPEKDSATAKVSITAAGELEANFEEEAGVGVVTFTKMSGGCQLVVVTDDDQEALQDALKAVPFNELIQTLAAVPLTGPGPAMEAAKKAPEADPPPSVVPDPALPETLESLKRSYNRCYYVKPEHMPTDMEADTRKKVKFLLVVLSPTEMRSSTMVTMEGMGMVQWHSWTHVGD